MTESFCTCASAEPGGAIRVGQITLLIDRYIVKVGKRRTQLTRVEYDLLLQLSRNVGKTFTMDQLARLDGDHAEPPTNRALRARVAALRRKCGDAGNQIENVRGIGYRLNDALTRP